MDPTISKSFKLIKLERKKLFFKNFFVKNTLVEKDTNSDNSCDTVGRVIIHTLHPDLSEDSRLSLHGIHTFFWFSLNLCLIFLSHNKACLSHISFMMLFNFIQHISVSMDPSYSKSSVPIVYFYLEFKVFYSLLFGRKMGKGLIFLVCMAIWRAGTSSVLL